MAVASLISAGFLGPGYYAPIASRMADALLRHWSAICNITENRVCGISAERRGGADMLRNVQHPSRVCTVCVLVAIAPVSPEAPVPTPILVLVYSHLR